MQITPLASTTTDNWFYAIEDDGDLLLVDPIDADVAIAHVRKRAPERVRIFNTHAHPDHIGGNDAVVEALACEVIASGHADVMEVNAQHRVVHGGNVTLGQRSWSVLHAPGHTMGHIMLHTQGHLISGDVLFVGGVGNCRFGGDPEVLFETITNVIEKLPGETTFYPGHDYALRNFEFCLEVEPTNARAKELVRLAEAHHNGDARRAPFLLTIGDERMYNPFFRTADPDVQAALQEKLAEVWPTDASSPDLAAFKALRSARDNF